MAIDFGSFSFGALVGAVVSELFKAAVKRAVDKNETKRKLIRDDLDSLDKRVQPLVQAAIKYYSANIDDAKDISRQIKADLQTFAKLWNRVDGRLKELNLPQLGSSPLVMLRKSLTCELDTDHPKRTDANDPVLSKMHSVGDQIHDAISNAKYGAT